MSQGEFPGHHGSPKGRSRVAEMAMELMGLKMTIEFMREAWAAAPLEARATIGRLSRQAF